jgi:hypothetical protein
MARKKKIDTTPTTSSHNDNKFIDSTIKLEIENTSEANDKPKNKRGRKSKKELLMMANNTHNSNTNNILKMEEFIKHDDDDDNNNIILTKISDYDEHIDVKPIAKKRGRKPKGGKIIQQVKNVVEVKESKPNIILHLKCYLKDLHNNIFCSNNINGYDFTCNKNELYEVISNNEEVFLNTKNCVINTNDDDGYISNGSNDENIYKSNKKSELKDLWRKLKNLQHSLHLNNISDKKSACFWCTYEFDNPAIYIPKHYIKDSYHVYGCFCSPECATAYLMEENIDSSTKFERYYLINHIYSKIYQYSKNIKPAPNPHYMLDKYYGNLTIQEYRALLKSERLFLIVDKPLTRILPEFHEDNDEFIINNKIIPSNNFQLKKRLQKKQQTKNNILNEKFGISSS